MTDSTDFDAIAKTAWDLQNKHTEADLLDMLVEEWSKASGDEVATRGEFTDYLKGVARRIARGIIGSKDLTVATMGLITSEVIKFMSASGYDLDLYRLAIAILVSLVTKAVLEEMEVMLEKK